MSLRDLTVTAIVLLSLPTGFRTPFVGLLTFTWLAYMRAQDLCWGFARQARFSYIVGIAMLVGWIVHESSRRGFTRIDLRSGLMILLIVFTTISLSLAVDQSQFVLRRYMEFLKIVVIALFTIGQVDSKRRLDLILWTIAISLGFFGFKGGIFGVMTGGSPIIRGPGGMLEDNNDFALALVMNVPLLVYLGRLHAKIWVRRIAFAAALLTIGTIVLTRSRGGFLALSCVLFVFYLRSRYKLLGLCVVAAGVTAFFMVAPQMVFERLATLSDIQSDSSAMGRLRAWQVSLDIIADNPILGIGIRNFQAYWPTYATRAFGGEIGGFAPVAHNSYLQIWAEGGTIAIGVYLAMIGSTFIALRRLRRLGLRAPDKPWIFEYARMFEASLVGFCVGGMFLNRGHFDLIYHLIALVSCFYLIAMRHLRGEERSPEADGERPALELRTTRSWGPPGHSAPVWGR